MSGGSWGYPDAVWSGTGIDHYDWRGIAARLKELGCLVAAARVQRLADKLDEAAQVRESLREVLHALDYYDSGDYGVEKSFKWKTN